MIVCLARRLIRRSVEAIPVRRLWPAFLDFPASGPVVGQATASSSPRSCTIPATRPLPPENLKQEWIELFNRGAQTVNLAGWRFSDGVDFVFPGRGARGGPVPGRGGRCECLQGQVPRRDQCRGRLDRLAEQFRREDRIGRSPPARWWTSSSTRIKATGPCASWGQWTVASGAGSGPMPTMAAANLWS